MISPPGDERPVGAMPEPAQEHDQNEIDVGSSLPLAVTTQGNVKIVAQECAQRDVPAPPEVGDALGLVGRVEILQELKTEHPSQADGHVGVTGEIEVNLERVGQCAEPGVRRGQRLGANAASATRPSGLASNIFLAKPRTKRMTPEPNFPHV